MTRFTCLIAALLFAGLVAVVQPSRAQVPPSGTAPQAQGQQDHEAPHPAAAEQPVTQAQETEMAGMRQKMIAEMDARLDALVTKMNTANGDAKMEAMSELLTAIVQQRATMRDRMMNMQSQMMGHMMQHMSAGMSPEMKKMMAECPMMKQMGAAKEK